VAFILVLGTGDESRAGNRQLEVMRSRYHHLNPGWNPSMATYGATGAALSVGLFGAGALWPPIRRSRPTSSGCTAAPAGRAAVAAVAAVV